MSQTKSDSRLAGTRTVRPLPDHARLRASILEGMGAALFVCDAEKRGFPIVQISPAFTAITGYQEAEALAGKLSLLYGSMTDARTTKAVNDALRASRAFRGDLLCYRADGSTVWCELTIAAVADDDGAPACLAGVLTDISERKQGEARLQSQAARFRGVFENAVEGIYQSTPAGGYVRVNQALATMYGYRNPEALLKQVSDIQQQIYVDPGMRERFKQLIEATNEVRGLEYQIRRRDGRIIWISESARIVRDANGKPSYYEGFVMEITRRKQAEVAFQEAQQRLMETSRQLALVEVTNGVVHNVGNALNSVNVSASLLAGKLGRSLGGNLVKAAAMMRRHEAHLAQFLKDDPRGSQLLGYLEELAQHLVKEQAGLQEELKSLRKSVEHASQILARQQAHARTSGRRESVPVAELVEDALLMNAHSLARHHVEVVREYAPNLPTVQVQKHLVLQILVNLIRNAGQACAATGATAKRLTLRLSVSPADCRIKIAVQDSGVGIAPENLSRLFTHGFTTRKDGHGFGLNSAERMAREMGGSLTAHSAGVGQGACFILEFPGQATGGKGE